MGTPKGIKGGQSAMGHERYPNLACAICQTCGDGKKIG